MTLSLTWKTQPSESDTLENYNSSGKTNIDSISSNFQSIETQVYTNKMAIAALLAASGVKVSANDTTTGYLNGKLVGETGITLTENNNGGNETLTISLNIEYESQYYII